MADQLLKTAQDLLEGQIDFEGQKSAELATTLILAGTGLIALVLGYFQENIHVTLWVGLLGTAFAFLIVVPPFPIYNEYPEKWLRTDTGVSAIEVDGKRIT
ncbi:hypothetical protein MMC20_006746 [Loxospora ochrophaea]|nr:hypothetical protein [Loxospora ochrophaea]